MNMNLNPIFQPFQPIFRHKKIKKESHFSATLWFSSGATGNRTRDTRIFSPLLYQLSYGTVVEWECKSKSYFGFCKIF